ncbi:MAG: hypothetical protein WC008_05650 [Bacilli bacterium]
MIKRLIVLDLVLIMCLCLLAGCGSGYHYDRVEVFVKAEYLEKFNEKNFTLEDFSFDNIEKFDYFIYQEFDDEQSRVQGSEHFRVYLKKGGRYQVNKAIDHFKQLEFVERVEKIIQGTDPGIEY